MSRKNRAKRAQGVNLKETQHSMARQRAEEDGTKKEVGNEQPKCGVKKILKEEKKMYLLMK